MLCGATAMAMNSDDVIVAAIQAAEREAGCQMSRDAICRALLTAADWYDGLAAAARKYANGPQLRIVKPDDQ